MKYTVTWEQTALAALAKLWCDHPNLHNEIQKASDEIDRVLLRNPYRFDVFYHESTCELGVPPLAVLYRVYDDDRLVKVLAIKLIPPHP
jgi:hypothetical protein